MLLTYLALVNLAAFLLFGLDKHRARHGGRRIPEKQLFAAALAGGTIGALAGMRFFRHKTLHRRFNAALPLILMLQSGAGTYLYLQLNR